MTADGGARPMGKDKVKPKSLGRGLSSLLGDDLSVLAADDPALGATPSAPPGPPRTVPIGSLTPSPYQPRRVFDNDAINELADSIRVRGILQPILVRPATGQPGQFEIIAGERRWRAAQKAQLHDIPVVLRSFSDQEALEIALVENLQRQDLSPLEEAEGYRRLMDEFLHTQEALGKAVGKSRSHVANMMRLLALPDPVKAMMDNGSLSAGHARALLGATDPERLARLVVERGLTVRQTEELVKTDGGKPGRGPTPTPTAPLPKDADTAALERDLSSLLGLRVTIRFGGRGGDLIIHYDTLEQLDDILNRLNQEAPHGPTAPHAVDPTEEVLSSAEAERFEVDADGVIIEADTTGA